MITLTYFQFAIFLVIALILGIGFAWRIERNRYENLIDIFRTKNDKLAEALRDEMLKNEKLNQQNSDLQASLVRVKKRLNFIYKKK